MEYKVSEPRYGVASLKDRSFLAIADLSVDELNGLLRVAAELKRAFKSENHEIVHSKPLTGKSMSMIFQKRSTRTRVSTETGMSLLGGHALFLGPSDIQLGVNETLKDTALVLSRFNSILLARVYDHEDIQTLAKEATVPVINALSSLHHPLQALADMLTLQERFGANLQGRTIAWVGDGNNVLHDLALAAAALGMNIRVACPVSYDPDETIMQAVHQSCQRNERSLVLIRDPKEAVSGADVVRNGRNLVLTRDPKEAVSGADAVVTDTWVSMGQEAEKAHRLQQFAGYQVNAKLMSLAAPEAVFMHCLPRHSEEVHDEVFYSEKSLVFNEAENRMWTVMAVTLSLLGK